jgi:hypothetical protein
VIQEPHGIRQFCPREEGTVSRRVLIAAIALLLGGGCQSSPERNQAGQEEVSAREAASRQQAQQPAEGTRPYYTRNFAIVPVEWGRAEDVAATLDPIVKSQYGPEARVVPHVPTNRIFIYLPPQRPETRSAGRSAPVPVRPGPLR